MMSRKEELIQYVNLLKGMLREGFKCEKELNQALKELHLLMLPNKKKLSILVLEDDFEGIVKSVEFFEGLLGDSVNSRIREKDDHFFNTDSVNVSILNLSSVTQRHITGVRVDYIINNTSEKSIVDVASLNKILLNKN